MFYKQFLKITDVLNPEFVDSFDYWLTTLPSNDQKNITASTVSARLGVQYVMAQTILAYAEKQSILEKYYLVKCPDCDFILATITTNEIADYLMQPIFCGECEEDKHISSDDIYTAYKVVLRPDVTEEEISKAIEKRLSLEEGCSVNFSKADSLSNDKGTLYDAFYNPSESAYEKFNKLRIELDYDYGKNTTAKGNGLESLVLEIFREIKYVKATNDIKTQTNQFDCTCLSGMKTSFLSVFSYMAPYFIIECKNEPQKKPNNTYCNKLLSIMDTNEAQLGIIFGRKDATATCFSVSREHYLTHMHSNKQQVVLTFSDNDLKYIIDKRINLLQYLEFKIFQVTSGSSESKYEMFEKKDKTL